MSETATGGAARRKWSRRRIAIVIVGVLGALALAAAALYAIDNGDGFGLIDGDGGSYFAVFFLVFADAIIPIFPGETTLSAASTLAVQGTLELGAVMVAGALGAIVGDSTLYWIARKGGSHHAVADRLERANENPKIRTAFAYLDRGAPYLLVAGRFVPGMRFAVSATLGLARYPYKTFLLWSAIGGIAWSIYTCGLAYLIGTALADFPLASIVISGFITTAVLAALFFLERHHRRTNAAPPAAAEGASIAP